MHFNECIWLSIKSESVGSACWTHKRTMLSVGGAIHSNTCHHSPLLMLSVFGLRCSILRTYRQNIHPFISPTMHTQYTLTTHGLLYVVSRCADVCVCVCVIHTQLHVYLEGLCIRHCGRIQTVWTKRVLPIGFILRMCIEFHTVQYKWYIATLNGNMTLLFHSTWYPLL